jgi:hypothetical protein
MGPVQPQSFPFLAYQGNPAYFQIGQTINLLPVPGTAQATYAITMGTLPVGLSLNASTGAITGVPTTLIADNITQITATFLNDSTYICNLTITITNIPLPAMESNQNSQQGLVGLSNYQTSLFIHDTNYMISNAYQLGHAWVDVQVPPLANMNTVRNYFQSLNYSFSLINFRANRFQINTPIGEFYSSGEFYKGGPFGNPFYQLPRPGYAYASPQNNRVRISWNPYPAGQFAPYYF